MFYAFDLNDAKDIDIVTPENIDKISIIGFNSLDSLEKFIERNYSFIGIYNYNEKYPSPIEFNNKSEAQSWLINCINLAGKHISI